MPDIGDFKDVPIIEILVKEGDAINAEDPLLTLESDKATMEVPAPSSGTVEKILVKVGDKVSEGTPILMFKGGEGAMTQPPSLVNQQEPPPQPQPVAVANATPAQADQAATSADRGPGATTGSGRRLRQRPRQPERAPGGARARRRPDQDEGQRREGPDHQGRRAELPERAERRAGRGGALGRHAGIPEIPAVDFSKFGPIETKPLPRIKKLSGPHLHRAWLNVPHVTHNDESDITEIDAYRKELDSAAKDKGYRVTLLAFLMKAAVSALREFPDFNSSLSPEKDSLIVKKYYHIGIAVDTPEGLVVPVIRDVDRKGIHELSQELGSASKKARDGKLSSADMQGACFTISSLGGIGGTGFTPIVNAPEVAILGVVRSKMAPVWNGEEFVPRLMLPVSLSYDHRVIDGALAARFTRHLCHVLEDVRRLVL